MADIKSPEPEHDGAADDLWTLIKQLRMRDLVDAIKRITLDDFQHFTNVARGRSLNFETSTLLCKEFIKTRTGCVVLGAVIATISTVIISVYSAEHPPLLLAALRLINAGPAAGSVDPATRSTSSASRVVETLQSAAMAGYEDPVVVALVQGTVVAGVIFAAYKLWNMDKQKDAWVIFLTAGFSSAVRKVNEC